ncbi:MAG: HlyC/CorC family transporter [Chloroflexi bacterium]|nr:HlyC/CorC family transporter [Chloroflexota bacterium]
MNDLTWFLIPIFVVLDWFFVAVRASLSQARMPQLLGMSEQKSERVERTLKLLEQVRLPVTLRISVILVHFLLIGTFTVLLVRGFGAAVSWQLLVAMWVLALLVLLQSEFLIERLILTQPERWALWLTVPGQIVHGLFSPVAWLLTLLLGNSESVPRSLASVTEDELKEWVETGQPAGSLEQGERKMIYSIFQFSDTLCREIMVPRIDVFALDINTSPAEAIQAVLRSGHSRFPVFEEVIDNIIGLLYAKDLLRISLNGNESTSIRELLRPAYFIPEAKKVDELLREMQARGVHMAVVVDEYDESEELLYQQLSPDEYLFLGRIDLDDFNDLLGTHLTKEVADTLGGFIYGEIGRVPVGGEQLTVEGWRLTVEQVSGRRIRKVRACRIPAEERAEEENESER